jgi:hypothetical protein
MDAWEVKIIIQLTKCISHNNHVYTVLKKLLRELDKFRLN